MKIILLLLILTLFINADEMKRIESIVNDITKLRDNYEECKKELKTNYINKNTPKLSVVKEKTITCNKEKKLIEKLENILINKDKIIYALENKIKKLQKTIYDKNKKFDNSNKFPKLMMKSKYIKNNKITKKLQIFKAKSFKLKNFSNIYDSVNGKRLDIWEKDTSFTSNTKSKEWTKITGYFVDKKWTKARESLWIRDENIVPK